MISVSSIIYGRGSYLHHFIDNLRFPILMNNLRLSNYMILSDIELDSPDLTLANGGGFLNGIGP
jgi:hypothetical protein